MKVAIIHHWLIKMGGAEKVIENFSHLYPNADIYTHVYNKAEISDVINKHNIKTTFINYLPFAKKFYKHYLLLMPLALKFLNLKEYDLIICSESGPTKGFRYNKKSFLVCYCNSPMRYIWDLNNIYLQNLNIFEKLITWIVFPLLRRWDVATAKKIDLIFANSHYISKRIYKFWGRKSIVVNPPINIDEFEISNNKKKYYLVLSRHVAYKRIDLAIKAFNELDSKLIVLGDGSETNKLKRLAKNNNIEFVGWIDDKLKKQYLANCKALIFPGIEDFGIVPIETMASGRPVIAFKKGGALDYIQDNINGVFFEEQSTVSLINAINYFEKNILNFNSEIIRQSILKFDSSIFQNNIKEYIKQNFKND